MSFYVRQDFDQTLLQQLLQGIERRTYPDTYRLNSDIGRVERVLAAAESKESFPALYDIGFTADDEKKRKSDERKFKRRMDKHNLMLDIYNVLQKKSPKRRSIKYLFSEVKKKRNKEELRLEISEDPLFIDDLDEQDVNTPLYGGTPLTAAIYNVHPVYVQQLVEKGARVDDYILIACQLFVSNQLGNLTGGIIQNIEFLAGHTSWSDELIAKVKKKLKTCRNEWKQSIFKEILEPYTGPLFKKRPRRTRQSANKKPRPNSEEQEQPSFEPYVDEGGSLHCLWHAELSEQHTGLRF